MNSSLVDIKPSATPSDEDIAAWKALSRDEQLARLKQHLNQPSCSKPTPHTMADILAVARQRIAARRNA